MQKTAQGDASATDDIAKLTSRTLQRTFKALVLLALLATAAVGAGMAYKLGAPARASRRRSVVPSLRRSVAPSRMQHFVCGANTPARLPHTPARRA